MLEENIIHSELSEEIEQSYLDYGMSVITDRALPDVRDGLKPVHRRILWTMYEAGFLSSKTYKKSATTVGAVMGSYHPHGDTSIYDAMVRLAQDFSMREMLVDGHGNFGSIDGDSAAAMRYTEARLSKIGELMLTDIKKNAVKMKNNFANDKLEPEVLPSHFPNLIVNGTTGIGVAMACSFAPHNLENATNLIKETLKRELTHEEVYSILKGPDFPTGGTIINEHELLNAYKTGRGRVRVRGEYNLIKRGQKDLIQFTSIPFMVKKEKLVSDIAKLAEEKIITEISDVRDESDHSISIIVELKKNANIELIISKIYAKTQMENTFSINQTCLVEGQPKVLSMKQIAKEYADFQLETLYNVTKFDLVKIQEKLHLNIGLIKALADIDKLIKIIKESSNKSIAETKLMKEFDIDDKQAAAILAMRLSKLTSLEIEQLKAAQEELLKEESEKEKVLSDKSYATNKIVVVLDTILNKYKSERKTKITSIVVTKTSANKDIAPIVDFSVRVDDKYFATKAVGKTKAIANSSLYLLDSGSDSRIITFTEDGRVHSIKTDEIVEGIDLKINSDSSTIKHVDSSKSNTQYLLFFTSDGKIKKTLFKEYITAKRSSTALKLAEGEKVIGIIAVSDSDPTVAIASKDGQLIMFETNEINPVGKNAAGVVGIKLSDGDSATSCTSVNKEFLNILSYGGYAKRVLIKDIPLQKRGGKGSKIMRNDLEKVKFIFTTNEKNSIILLTDIAKTKIDNSSFPIMDRVSKGKLLIKNNILNIYSIGD